MRRNPHRGRKIQNKEINSEDFALIKKYIYIFAPINTRIMKILNNTHYFNEMSRTYNEVPDNYSFSFESSKRRGYSQRLYWEFQYMKKVNGQAFFWTLTYNDHSLPHQFGKNVFDYSHVRLVTNGLISKELKRKYGSSLRYFCACERGEGKGSRGKGNNPHYHFIFFVYPIPDDKRKTSDVPYKRISPYAFAELVKKVWQYQTTTDSYKRVITDYKSARFGHAQSGNDMGLVTSSDALGYVSKYCTKDAVEKSLHKDVYIHYFHLAHRYFQIYLEHNKLPWIAFQNYYYYLNFINGTTLEQFADTFALHDYRHWRKVTGYVDKSYIHYLETYRPDVLAIVNTDFKKYCYEVFLLQYAKESYHTWRNRYGAKTRCSKSLGIYGLEHIRNTQVDPHFLMSTPRQMVTQRIGLYYYRKLYMDTTICPHSGNVLYILNGAGVKLKLHQLPDAIDNCIRNVHSALELYSQQHDSNEYICMRNCHTRLDFDSIIPTITDDIIHRFAIYKLVYQYRHIDLSKEYNTCVYNFNMEQVKADYIRFLTECNIYTCDYDQVLTLWLKREHSCCIVSYDNHPAFNKHIKQFRILSALLDSYFTITSDIKKSKFDERSSLHQKLNAIKYN